MKLFAPENLVVIAVVSIGLSLSAGNGIVAFWFSPSCVPHSVQSWASSTNASR